MAQFLLAAPPSLTIPTQTLGNVLMAPVVPAVDEFNARFGTRVWSAYNMTEISVPTWLREWHAGDTTELRLGTDRLSLLSTEDRRRARHRVSHQVTSGS